MIETDHRFEVDAPIGEVWAYASDIGNWASSMPGYESFESVDELRSNWVLKVALGALTKRIQLNVAITDRHEPDHITFELEGASEPVAGRGTFTAASKPRRRHQSWSPWRSGGTAQWPRRWRRCPVRSFPA